MLLKVKEAAAYIGYGETSLRAMMKNGEIAFHQRAPGARCLLDTAELDRFNASTQRGGRPAKHINGTLRKRRS